MGYFLQAIIGTQAALEVRSIDFPSAVVAPLAHGFALIPITDGLLDEVGASGASGRFEKFTPAVADWLRVISVSAPAAYIEAEFFGGVGGQSAVVWSHGQQLLAPVHDAEAINTALRLLGVPCGTSRDEFEAIGLPRHRNTEDWWEDALSKTRDA